MKVDQQQFDDRPPLGCPETNDPDWCRHRRSWQRIMLLNLSQWYDPRKDRSVTRRVVALIVSGLVACVLIVMTIGLGQIGALGIAIALALLTLSMIRRETRMDKRTINYIVTVRPCLRCGYSLVGHSVDDAGRGRCPECGQSFRDDYYIAPDR